MAREIRIITRYGHELNQTQAHGVASLMKLLYKEAHWAKEFSMYDAFKSYFEIKEIKK